MKKCHCMLRDRKDVAGTVIDFCPLHKAAPKLLEALKSLIDVHENNGGLHGKEWNDRQFAAWSKAQAVLAEAEGI